jgi:hypothetical protein
MKAKRLRVPNAEQFLNSKLYTSFFKFAQFAIKTHVPNTEQYIKFMVREDIPPTIWTNDQIYGEYLKYLDRGADPFKQAEATTLFAMDLAEDIGCSTGEIFDNITPNEIILFLQQRRLSPWILLHSRKFMEFAAAAPMEQQQQISAIVKPGSWKQRRIDNPTVVAKMKEIVTELNW